MFQFISYIREKLSVETVPEVSRPDLERGCTPEIQPTITFTCVFTRIISFFAKKPYPESNENTETEFSYYCTASNVDPNWFPFLNNLDIFIYNLFHNSLIEADVEIWCKIQNFITKGIQEAINANNDIKFVGLANAVFSIVEMNYSLVSSTDFITKLLRICFIKIIRVSDANHQNILNKFSRGFRDTLDFLKKLDQILAISRLGRTKISEFSLLFHFEKSIGPLDKEKTLEAIINNKDIRSKLT